MLPAQRTCRARGRRRRSHDAIQPKGFVRCPYSGQWKRAHRACPETGYVPPKPGRAGFFVFGNKEEA